jgi:hypothetical protein
MTLPKHETIHLQACTVHDPMYTHDHLAREMCICGFVLARRRGRLSHTSLILQGTSSSTFRGMFQIYSIQSCPSLACQIHGNSIRLSDTVDVTLTRSIKMG